MISFSIGILTVLELEVLEENDEKERDEFEDLGVLGIEEEYDELRVVEGLERDLDLGDECEAPILDELEGMWYLWVKMFRLSKGQSGYIDLT